MMQVIIMLSIRILSPAPAVWEMPEITVPADISGLCFLYLTKLGKLAAHTRKHVANAWFSMIYGTVWWREAIWHIAVYTVLTITLWQFSRIHPNGPLSRPGSYPSDSRMSATAAVISATQCPRPCNCSSSPLRYFPVLTRIACKPASRAPTTSAMTSSPIMMTSDI